MADFSFGWGSRRKWLAARVRRAQKWMPGIPEPVPGIPGLVRVYLSQTQMILWQMLLWRVLLWERQMPTAGRCVPGLCG